MTHKALPSVAAGLDAWPNESEGVCDDFFVMRLCARFSLIAVGKVAIVELRHMLNPFEKNASKTLWFAGLMKDRVWVSEVPSELKCQIRIQD